MEISVSPCLQCLKVMACLARHSRSSNYIVMDNLSPRLSPSTVSYPLKDFVILTLFCSLGYTASQLLTLQDNVSFLPMLDSGKEPKNARAGTPVGSQLKWQILDKPNGMSTCVNSMFARVKGEEEAVTFWKDGGETHMETWGVSKASCLLHKTLHLKH